MKDTHFKKENETEEFSIYKLQLKTDQDIDFNIQECSGLIITINGSVDLKYYKTSSSAVIKNKTLNTGELFWCNFYKMGKITNNKRTDFKALIILLK